MARSKGTANLAASIEPLAGAPLDARNVCPTVEDLYISANWPYRYIGMKTTVTATGDTYRLVNMDVTQASSWVKEGATEYADFTGATSQATGIHGLVPAPAITDMEKFLKGDGTWGVVPMPSFDYSNTSPDAMNFSTDEKVIGTWIDGKPLYQKSFATTLNDDSEQTDISVNASVDKYISLNVMQHNGSYFRPLTFISNDLTTYIKTSATNNADAQLPNTLYIRNTNLNYRGTDVIVTIRYTKTTDQPVATGEKIVGQWIDGRPLYEKTFNGTLPNTKDGSWTNENIQDLTSLNIESLVYFDGIVANRFKINYTHTSEVFWNMWLDGTLDHIVSSGKWSVSTPQPYTITLQYTKAN